MPKHKHEWQFAKLEKPTIVQYYEDNPPTAESLEEIMKELPKQKATFICHCGKTKTVEVKK